ncbi:NF-kappa-B inhibitor zeta [Conger conger]|uniref:NF-kappa-B inhibitor zeta n=1 Tax=Conger conger TaxID=82655 RepID=UPI002A5A7345|nr:NF-kappa-B inhibitor zeta [Conger conger]
MFRSRNCSEDGSNFSSGSPLPGELASPQNKPNSPVSGFTQAKILEGSDISSNKNVQLKASTGSKLSQSEKRYLGVRVRMPVRDMLRKIRIAKGLDPNTIQGSQGKSSRATGEKKRVTSSGDRRKKLNKRQTSLEDLAIIVEVLEEDLKASEVHKQPQNEDSVSPQYCPDWQGSPWPFDLPCSSQEQPQEYGYPSETSPSSSPESCAFSPPPLPCSLHSIPPDSHGGHRTNEGEERSDGRSPRAPCSPGSPEYRAPSPSELRFHSPQPLSEKEGPARGLGGLGQYWSCMSFFWCQLQREESLLRGVSDEELLAPDGSGRILLHRVVSQGKRATVYSIAKRLASMGQLDIRDAEGKTALHLAAQRNQHLMVADLLLLGARVTERDRFGKTCLHLCAENGYVRVVEVLNNFMNNGMYVDVEARDINGLSALQCATLALNVAVQELEMSSGPSEQRFYTLRKEQLLDTLDCLLLIGQSSHAQSYESQMMWDVFRHGCSSYVDKVASAPQRKAF